MRLSLERRLRTDAPRFFQHLGTTTLRESLLCFGCECGDGWFALIRACALQIETLNRRRSRHPIVASQVKEKFGGLRLYVSLPDQMATAQRDAVEAWILEAESLSERTCEVCGEPGHMASSRGWLRTVCPAHRIQERIWLWQLEHAEPGPDLAHELARIAGEPESVPDFARIVASMDQLRAHRGEMPDYEYLDPPPVAAEPGAQPASGPAPA